jgi:hypothetical protein
VSDALHYPLLADAVLAMHVAIVVFVGGGLFAIIVGNLRNWRWVNALWFRSVHLAAILIVIAEAWLGAVCPLTTLEMRLRQGRSGDVCRKLHRALAATHSVLRRPALGLHARLHNFRSGRRGNMVVLSAGIPSPRQ